MASRAGYRIGIVQLASTRLGASAIVHPGLSDLVERGVADLVLPGQAVHATLLIVKHPTVFAASLAGVLSIRADHIIVTAGQVPADDAGRYYDPAVVDANIHEALGRRAVWWPVSDTVRRTLTGVELAGGNWDEIIDVERWRAFGVESGTPASGSDDQQRPIVIGRHSRSDPMKWPSTTDELTAAYPTDGSAEVRVLGGAEPAIAMLGFMPEAWTVLPFGAQHPGVFLAGLDAFVYFHHRDMVEAFGRTVLEALAVGIPAVVAPSFESTFGEACLYAEPVDAIGVLRRLLADEDARQLHLAIADRVLRERFSHEAFSDRLGRLVGSPLDPLSESTASVPPVWNLIAPGQREAHRVELVVALGETTDEIADLLAHLDAHRRRLPGFIPIVVMTCTRPIGSEAVGIETKVITSRRNHGDATQRWEDYAHRRIREIAASYDVDDIVAANARHPDAWIALQLRRRRRSDRGVER